jgi:hypothetical protein
MPPPELLDELDELLLDELLLDELLLDELLLDELLLDELDDELELTLEPPEPSPPPPVATGGLSGSTPWAQWTKAALTVQRTR